VFSRFYGYRQPRIHTVTHILTPSCDFFLFDFVPLSPRRESSPPVFLFNVTPFFPVLYLSLLLVLVLLLHLHPFFYGCVDFIWTRREGLTMLSLT
jgi:hypothetical protein